MIRCIVAIDSKRGMADEHGIPWQGKVPADVAHFRDKTSGGIMVMGFRTYEEFDRPLPGRRNLVITHDDKPLRAGFEPIRNVSVFLQEFQEDVWVIGGAKVFADTLGYADELYLTRIEGDFQCTKFFPEFENDFELIQTEEPQAENGITFHFEIWKRKAKT